MLLSLPAVLFSCVLVEVSVFYSTACLSNLGSEVVIMMTKPSRLSFDSLIEKEAVELWLDQYNDWCMCVAMLAEYGQRPHGQGSLEKGSLCLGN